MDTDRLLEKLRKLYILTLDYEFHKSSYAKYMDSLRSNYADLLQEAADRTYRCLHSGICLWRTGSDQFQEKERLKSA